MPRIKLALCVLGAVLAGGAQAQVNKCVDAAGKTVYSEAPCPRGAKSKVLRQPPPPAAQPATVQTAPGDAKADARPGPASAAEQTAEAKLAQEYCAGAKEQVAQFEAVGRIVRLDEKGERYFLSDEQRAQEKARLQAWVAQNCK